MALYRIYWTEKGQARPVYMSHEHASNAVRARTQFIKKKKAVKADIRVLNVQEAKAK